MSAALRLHKPTMRTRDRSKFTSMHPAVLLALAARPMTDQELGIRLGCTDAHARGRRAELTRMGLVEHSGKERKTASGRHAAVWRASPAGRVKADQLRRKHRG